MLHPLLFCLSVLAISVMRDAAPSSILPFCPRNKSNAPSSILPLCPRSKCNVGMCELPLPHSPFVLYEEPSGFGLKLVFAQHNTTFSWSLDELQARINMEMQGEEEIEGVMEKAWDLHDKMSDAISTLSKSHCLLNSVHHHHETTVGSENFGSFIRIPNTQHFAAPDAMQEKGGEENQVAETISLNTIRGSLKALEDQLHFLHIQQSQQRAERNATLTQLEESRLILLRRLTEHQGRQWDFIQEGLAFAAYRYEEEDLHVSPSSFLYPTVSQVDGAIYSEKKMVFDDKIGDCQKNSFNGLTHFLSISIQFVKNSDRLHKIARVVAKAAFVAVGMLGMQQMGQRRTKRDPFHEKSRAHMYNNQFKKKEKFRSTEDNFQNHTTSEIMDLPSHLQPNNLNVIFGRG